MVLRMEYIRRFLPHASKDKTMYGKYVQDIKGANGIHAIEQIAADSKLYQKMRQDTDIS